MIVFLWVLSSLLFFPYRSTDYHVTVCWTLCLVIWLMFRNCCLVWHFPTYHLLSTLCIDITLTSLWMSICRAEQTISRVGVLQGMVRIIKHKNCYLKSIDSITLMTISISTLLFAFFFGDHLSTPSLPTVATWGVNESLCPITWLQSSWSGEQTALSTDQLEQYELGHWGSKWWSIHCLWETHVLCTHYHMYRRFVLSKNTPVVSLYSLQWSIPTHFITAFSFDDRISTPSLLTIDCFRLM